MNPMDPINLQRQIRNNSNDLMNFCADLKQWGEEMKEKDRSLSEEKSADVPLVRNKGKKKSNSKEHKSEKNESVKKKPKQLLDYSAWDKFDVEAECAKIDTQKSDGDDDDSSELTDECDETLQEEAIYQKEKGNKFVKNKKWNQAIQCYTKAIECYAYDPTFYANRALCHLKNLDYRLAECDCTTAIQLDKTYVKAYHRRATAREALNQLNEAHDDLLKVFDYEPNNKESKAALVMLEKKLETIAKESCTKMVEPRPKSKFTLSRQQQKLPPNKTQNANNVAIKQETFNTGMSKSARTTYWPSGNNIELINPIIKPPHLRSKASLRRINISSTDSIKILQKEKNLAQPLPSDHSNNTIIKCDDFKVVERKSEQYNRIEEIAPNNNKYKREAIPEKQNKNDTFCFNVPETSVQFNYDWRLLKSNSEWKYLYLKQVHPLNLKKIFNESLECDIFSGIINTLAEGFIIKKIPVYHYIIGLTQVKRFNMLALFMSDTDKKDLWKLVDYMRDDETIPKEDIDNIINKYSL